MREAADGFFPEEALPEVTQLPAQLVDSGAEQDTVRETDEEEEIIVDDLLLGVRVAVHLDQQHALGRGVREVLGLEFLEEGVRVQTEDPDGVVRVADGEELAPLAAGGDAADVQANDLGVLRLPHPLDEPVLRVKFEVDDVIGLESDDDLSVVSAGAHDLASSEGDFLENLVDDVVDSHARNLDPGMVFEELNQDTSALLVDTRMEDFLDGLTDLKNCRRVDI